jgi:Domain of unknown function (DUF4168)
LELNSPKIVQTIQPVDTLVVKSKIMLNTYLSITRPSFNRIVSQTLIISLLSSVGLLSGLIPEVTRQTAAPSLTFSYSVQAQGDELYRFARAAYAIEQRRKAVAEQIRGITGSVPNVSCEQINQLPSNARPPMQEFCNFSAQTIQQNGLTVERFNQIQSQRQSNPDIERRINQEIQRLQKF